MEIRCVCVWFCRHLYLQNGETLPSCCYGSFFCHRHHQFVQHRNVLLLSCLERTCKSEWLTQKHLNTLPSSQLCTKNILLVLLPAIVWHGLPLFKGQVCRRKCRPRLGVRVGRRQVPCRPATSDGRPAPSTPPAGANCRSGLGDTYRMQPGANLETTHGFVGRPVAVSDGGSCVGRGASVSDGGAARWGLPQSRKKNRASLAN